MGKISRADMLGTYTDRPGKRAYCENSRQYKTLYPSQEAAEKFIREQRVNIFKHSGKMPVRAYRCPTCKAWHITSISKDNTREDCYRLRKRKNTK